MYSIITAVLGKWASDIKCSMQSCSYRVFNVTATPHTDIQGMLSNHVLSLCNADIYSLWL